MKTFDEIHRIDLIFGIGHSTHVFGHSNRVLTFTDRT